jgi:hypothetical protein
VGSGVTALANGNYVVASPHWFGDTGAVTLGNGATGTTVGAVSAANSLVGSISGDLVGEFGVAALSNGNYVVSSPHWNNSAVGTVAVGAVTWGDGTKGVAGIVSADNSLVGSSPNDEVGFRHVTLPNGNYVVESLLWNQQAGALTWGNGTTGVSGTVSTTNSFTNVGSVDGGIFVLPNSDYIFWNGSGGTSNSSTWFDGSSGMTLDGQNKSDPQNTFTGGFLGDIHPLPSGNLFVAGTTVATTDPNDLTYALGEGQTITVAPSFLTRALDAGTYVTLQSNDDITIDSPITETPTGNPGSLTLEAGRSILINAGVNTAGGNLSLIANDTVADGVINSERDPGNADITMTSGATLETGSGSLLVDLEQSTDKTNNGRGTVTLLGINASTFTLAPGSTLDVSIKGTTPGDGVAAGTYTQINASGSIDLNNAMLQVVTSTAFDAGTTFKIVQSGSGVTGTFDGLPEGSRVAATNGSEFTISYQGDGGDAVVLTALGAAPAVTGVSPATGPTTGGTLVTITGTSFTGATAVDFGTTAATNVTVVSSTEMTADSPAGAGVVDVTVTTPAGKSATSTFDQFTYVAVPTVTGVSPNSGPPAGGTVVTIIGTNLLDATAVDFGTTAVTSFSGDTAGQIIVLSPPGTGTVDVNVVTPAGTSATSSADQYRYVSPASPTNLSAVSGNGTFEETATLTATLTASGVPVAGGTVTFTLSEGGTIQTVGTATTDADGVATLTGVSLAGFNAGTYPGAVGASFAGNPTYAGSSASGTLVVSATPQPAVTGVSPVTGPTKGGAQVTITGANLAGATAVNFGSTPVTSFLSDTATQITLLSPAGTGTVDATVTTAAGTSAISSADQYRYVPPRALPTSLSAVSGSGTIGGTATLTSTLTASAVPLAGRTVTFTLTEGGTVVTLGTATTDANGVATLTGVSLAGLPAGSYLGAVGASFAGDSTYAGSGASGTLIVKALPTPSPTPMTTPTKTLFIVGEQPLFRRKTTKKGKPIGNPVLTGFVFDFSDALNPSSATSNTNYQVDTVATKRVKKQTRRILHPITSFSVAYSAANDSVTLTFAGKQTFRTWGQITVVGGTPTGVTGMSGAALSGRTDFTISSGGRNIVAQ